MFQVETTQVYGTYLWKDWWN